MPRVLGILTRATNGRWEAEFPDLPGCSVSAPSIGLLREAARLAVAAALRESQSRREPPPELSDWEKLARHPLSRGAMVIAVDLP